MTAALALIGFVLAVVLYGAATALFFLGVARKAPPPSAPAAAGSSRLPRLLAARPAFLGGAAFFHGAYVTIASFVAHVCPIHSMHFVLSVASLLAIGMYLVARRRFRIDALGVVVAPLGLAFLLGTYFLGRPGPATPLSPSFIALHVMANLVGVALFLLACGAATLYLVQEKRLKQHRSMARMGNLPPLDTLDTAVHRFLVAGFPLLTLGILTGTFSAQKLEAGAPDDVMRFVLGYTTWLLVAAVLLLRAAAGWRGRRAAYGTIAGFLCAAAVLVIYLVRPSGGLPGGG